MDCNSLVERLGLGNERFKREACLKFTHVFAYFLFSKLKTDLQNEILFLEYIDFSAQGI